MDSQCCTLKRGKSGSGWLIVGSGWVIVERVHDVGMVRGLYVKIGEPC